MTGADEDGWRRVAARTDVVAGKLFAARHGDVPIVLVDLDGQVHALNNICPHAFALMSEGYLEGDRLECPLHGAVFEVRTGKCLDGPVDQDLPAYQVRVEGGEVWVRVTDIL